MFSGGAGAPPFVFQTSTILNKMASANIVTLTQDNFQSEVLQSATPVLVDFWAEWCGPCKMMAPALDELATEFGGKAKIAKLNVDDQQALAANYRVSSI